MRIARTLVALLCVGSMAGTIVPNAAASPAVATSTQQVPSENVKTMAGILARLNHFPNDAEKKTLQTIVDSETATAPEKTIAQALLGMQHTVTPDDKARLEAIGKDGNVPDPVRTLATILAGLVHTASADQKAQLTRIAAA